MHSIWDYFGRSRFNYWMVVGLVVLGLSGVGAAADGLSAAAVAVAGFTLPEGMTMTAVAADPLVANPVAFCFDEQGPDLRRGNAASSRCRCGGDAVSRRLHWAFQ